MSELIDTKARNNALSRQGAAAKQEYDMVKIAEVLYERMRSLNKTNLIQVDVKKSVGNILGSLSFDDVWSNPKDSAISSSIAEMRASMLARGVGPLEEVPTADYIQDSVRAKNFVAHTQVRAEQKLIAKLVQMRGNSRTPLNQLTYPEDEALNNHRHYYPIMAEGHGAKKGDIWRLQATGRNKWKQDAQYNAAKAKELRPVVENFTLAIENMAFDTPKKVYFPAYIKGFNESTSSSWSDIALINRSENIYVYQRAERSFNLEFVIFATTAEEIKVEEDKPFPSTITISSGLEETTEVGLMSKQMMWDRINFLHTLVRPSYRTTQSGKISGTFNKAPYAKLYIGDMFNGFYCIVDSINFNYDPAFWDIGVEKATTLGVRPMMVDVSIAGKIIHNTAPNVTTNFYGTPEG